MLPLYPHIPITKKHSNVEQHKVKLLLSLYGDQIQKVDSGVIASLISVAAKVLNVEVTVLACKRLNKHTSKIIKDAGKNLGTRWVVRNTEDWKTIAVEMCKHDLVIWTSWSDGLGIIPTLSLCMGTPVVSWQAKPMNEYLLGGRNAILVNCEYQEDWVGMPIVTPNYKEFTRVLTWLVNNPQGMSELRRHTHEGLEENKQRFNKVWDEVLS